MPRSSKTANQDVVITPEGERYRFGLQIAEDLGEDEALAYARRVLRTADAVLVRGYYPLLSNGRSTAWGPLKGTGWTAYRR